MSKIIFEIAQLNNNDNQISGVLFQFGNTNKNGYRIEAVSDQFWQDLENEPPVNIDHNNQAIGKISGYSVLKNKIIVSLDLNEEYKEKVKNKEFSHLSWEGQAENIRTGQDLTLEVLLNTKDRHSNPIPARLVKLNGVALTSNPSHLEAKLDNLINNFNINNNNNNNNNNMFTLQNIRTSYQDFEYIAKMSDQELKNNYFELVEPMAEDEIKQENLKEVVDSLINEDEKLKIEAEKKEPEKKEPEKKEPEDLKNSLKSLAKQGKLLTIEQNATDWAKNEQMRLNDHQSNSDHLIAKISDQLENAFTTGTGSPNLGSPEIAEFTSQNNFLNIYTDYAVDPKKTPIEEYSTDNSPARASYAEGSADSLADFANIYENEIFPTREVKWSMRVTNQKINSGALTFPQISRIMLNSISEWRTYYALYGTTGIEGIVGNSNITATTGAATYTTNDYVKALKDKSEGVLPAGDTPGEFMFVMSLRQYFKHLIFMMAEFGKTEIDSQLLAISKFKAGQLYLPVSIMGGWKGIVLPDRVIPTTANKSSMFYGNLKTLKVRDQKAPYIRSLPSGSNMDFTATTDAMDSVAGAPKQVGYMTTIDVA